MMNSVRAVKMKPKTEFFGSDQITLPAQHRKITEILLLKLVDLKQGQKIWPSNSNNNGEPKCVFYIGNIITYKIKTKRDS